MSLTKLTKPVFNKREGKYYVPEKYAAEWKPGPCVVWEITGECRNGKCTCAHLDREALNEKNHANELGNYVESTLKARCRYVLKQIRDGAWSLMKGQVREEAPCLVELLQWLPAQPDGVIDVDMVHSFIAANKIVAKKAAEEHSPEAVAEWKRLCAERNRLLTENAGLLLQLGCEQWRLTEVVARNEAAKEAAEAARRVAVKKTYAAALKSGGADSASVNEVATKAPVAPAVKSVDAKKGPVISGQVEHPLLREVSDYVEEKGWARIVDEDD